MTSEHKARLLSEARAALAQASRTYRDIESTGCDLAAAHQAILDLTRAVELLLEIVTASELTHG